MTINVPPSVEFLPVDVTDAGLAELRELSLLAMAPGPRFGSWLHSWCDAEQARRARGETTCTERHSVCLPFMGEWTNAEAAGAIEAVSIMVHNVTDWTASQFAERLQLALACEAARRLRTLEGKQNGI